MPECQRKRETLMSPGKQPSRKTVPVLRTEAVTDKCSLNECMHADRKRQRGEINPDTTVMDSKLVRILTLIHKVRKGLFASCPFLYPP